LSENKFDPKIIGEFLNFSRNLAEAPMKVSVPHEVEIGSTKFDVVYKEDKIRLLHFKPLTEKQVRTPLLISYAIVNRYHIFDIDPKKSWVRNLLEQGFDVYLIDWGTPTKIDQFLGFDEYVNGYMDNCVDFICKEADVDKISIQGYCTGGTLATVYSSLHSDRVKNLIVTAPVIDGWKDTTVVSNIAKYFDVCIEAGKETSMEAADNSLVAFKNWNGVDTLKNIKNETLIVWGDQDKSYNLEQVQTLEKNIVKSN